MMMACLCTMQMIFQSMNFGASNHWSLHTIKVKIKRKKIYNFLVIYLVVGVSYISIQYEWCSPNQRTMLNITHSRIINDCRRKIRGIDRERDLTTSHEDKGKGTWKRRGFLRGHNHCHTCSLCSSSFHSFLLYYYNFNTHYYYCCCC